MHLVAATAVATIRRRDEDDGIEMGVP